MTHVIEQQKFSFKRLTKADWSWFHFKIALLAWSITLLIYTPIPIANALGPVAAVFTSLTAVGVVISLVGLVMSAQIGKIGLIGLTVEYSGIIFTFAGPVNYLITQIYLAVKEPDGHNRYALCVLAYVVISALAARFRIVRNRRVKALNVPDPE